MQLHKTITQMRFPAASLDLYPQRKPKTIFHETFHDPFFCSATEKYFDHALSGLRRMRVQITRKSVNTSKSGFKNRRTLYFLKFHKT